SVSANVDDGIKLQRLQFFHQRVRSVLKYYRTIWLLDRKIERVTLVSGLKDRSTFDVNSGHKLTCDFYDLPRLGKNPVKGFDASIQLPVGLLFRSFVNCSNHCVQSGAIATACKNQRLLHVEFGYQEYKLGKKSMCSICLLCAPCGSITIQSFEPHRAHIRYIGFQPFAEARINLSLIALPSPSSGTNSARINFTGIFSSIRMAAKRLRAASSMSPTSDNTV